MVWKAAALNTVLSRFTEDEVLYTLNYGRNGVMPAWGGPGGGPLTTQQLEEVVFYLRSIQIDEETIRTEVAGGIMTQVQDFLIDESDANYAATVRDARDAQAEAADAVTAAELDCADETDGEASACTDLAAANQALTEANDAAKALLEADATKWIADAQAVAATAREMAIADDPSLGEEGNEDALRWAALELLSEPGAVPNQELYLQYGEFVFTNPAAQGTYSRALPHL
ncbi:MAG: hypothetical protein R2695_07215 [Acidimicrobiales bacterium]